APRGSAKASTTAAPAADGPGAPPPAGGNGGATDVGVTATTITVGNVADLSGPVPGLFQGAPYGVEAYFAYVNANGGVYGRQLRIAGADSQTDCTANQNAHTSLLPKVFAFVGSFAIYDDCGTQVLKQNPTVPDLSYPLGPETKANNVNNYPPQASPTGYQNGMFCYWAKKYGDAVQHVGSIYNAIPSVTLTEKSFVNAGGTCGWKWVDNIGVGATQTTFQAEVSRMQSDGVKIVYISATNTGNAAELKREADAQDWHPIWIMPLAYSSDFISRLGDPKEAEGIVGSQLYSLFFGAADAKNIPEVALYQQWMSRVVPNAPLELYSAYSWGAAKLFVQVLKSVGPDLTRQAFTNAIRKVHDLDTGGFLAPTDPAGHVPSPCYALWVIQNGQYVRQDTPASGFRCDGQFVPYTGG
ncbi:MAG TPA: ABC transporter substrate-binding protein, partial [Mycobacteriales bacterium]|nr:ABC transporter substrate-binding protein [Mycobacteriales bacterium]